MGIEQLLAAAKILEEREASDKRLRTTEKKARRPNKRSPSYRRAHLRDCLETLKELVPTPPDHQKSTTLSLLQNARHYITVLENTDRKAMATKQKLQQERMRLCKQLSQLKGELQVKIRKNSETSSCDDEIEVEDTGYHSESDDRCSTDSSGGSDGGF